MDLSLFDEKNLQNLDYSNHPIEEGSANSSFSSTN